MNPEDRLPFNFTAQLSIALSLDPQEFKGQGQAQVAETIRRTLMDINPSVSYFTDEITMASELIAGINEANGQG